MNSVNHRAAILKYK